MDERDARFKMLFLDSEVGISLVDINRCIVEVNPAFERMTGYSNEELRGKPFGKLLYDEDSAKNIVLHEELLAGKRNVYHMERRYVRKDGAVLWTRLTVSIYRDGQGTPQFTMGSMEDITEQKIAEAKLREQQQLLMQSSRMSALGEMAGGIAHEIQTPLTIIRFRAEALRKLAETGPLDQAAVARIVENTDQIEKTVMRISSIVKGLRAFARKGEQDPFQPVNVRSLIDETLELCRDKFKFRSIELIGPVVTHDLTFECRPTQIQQVLVNLLNNAYDAVQPLDEKWVRLEVLERPNTVEIWVTDSGKGMPRELAEKLFTGGGFTTKPVGQGTGLGLSISRSILDSHGGLLSVDSSSEHTRFIVCVPKKQPTPRPLRTDEAA